MVPADGASVIARGPSPVYGLIIDYGIQFLLLFSPLAFGSVQPWASAVLELAGFLILGAWFMGSVSRGRVEILRPAVVLLLLFLLLVLIVLVQLIPLPPEVLHAVSPEMYRLYADAGAVEQGNWLTISIHPFITRDELYKLLAYVAVFIVVLHHVRTKEQVERIAYTIIAMGVFLVVFAVIQKLFWNGRLYWVYPVGPGLVSNLNYIWGPYINRNHFAGYLELAAPLGMGMLLYNRLRMSQKEDRSGSIKNMIRFLSSHRLSRTALLATGVLIMAAGIILCVSRGGILGISVASLFFYVLARSRRVLRKYVSLFPLIFVIITLTVVAVAWERIEGRFSELGDHDKLARPAVWADAVGIVRDFPVFGTGFGTFNDIFPRYKTRYSGIRFEHAENDYLEIATDLGLSGFALSLAAMVVFFMSVMKAWRKRKNTFVLCIGAGGLASCMAIALHSITDFNLRVPANAMLLSIIAALTCAVVFTVDNSRPTDAY